MRDPRSRRCSAGSRGLCGGASALPRAAAGVAAEGGERPKAARCLSGAATEPGSLPGRLSRALFASPSSQIVLASPSHQIAFSPRLAAPPFRPEGLVREVPLPGEDSLVCWGPPTRPPPRSGAAGGGDFCLGEVSFGSSTRPGCLEDGLSRVFGVPPETGAASPACLGDGCGLGTQFSRNAALNGHNGCCCAASTPRDSAGWPRASNNGELGALHPLDARALISFQASFLPAKVHYKAQPGDCRLPPPPQLDFSARID